ncbi:NAD(+) hydrolase sarm1 isoform X2 [Condylostylus longicornis]|uniref:NAD(+) hydrolase sarm1 isoform X2 n=1 Tax=Condylostylus longicornis TaxID=2530218 RepID=UPI00244E51B9|nr:NAD(+) hydrolase sarm1 isoform X2 [Condylostylus longicornis]
MMSEQAKTSTKPQIFYSNSNKLKSERSTIHNSNIDNNKDKNSISTSSTGIKKTTAISPPPLSSQSSIKNLNEKQQYQQQLQYKMNNFNNNKIIGGAINNINQQQQQLQHNSKGQRVHNTLASSTSSKSTSTSSSSSSSKTEIKAHALQRDLSEMRSSMSEISDLALGKTNSTMASQKKLEEHQKILHSSLEKLIDNDCNVQSSNVMNTPEPLVTFPEDETNDYENGGGGGGGSNSGTNVNYIGITKLNSGVVCGENEYSNNNAGAENCGLGNIHGTNIVNIENSGGIETDNEIILPSGNQLTKNVPPNWQLNNYNNNCNNSIASSSLNFEEKRFRKESKTQFMSQEKFTSSRSNSISSEHAIRNASAMSAAASTESITGSGELNCIQNTGGGGIITETNKASAAIRNKYHMKEIRGKQQSLSLSSEAIQQQSQQQHQERSISTTTTTQQHLTTSATNQMQSNTFCMENHRMISQQQQQQQQQAQHHQKQSSYTTSSSSSTGITHVAASAQTNFKITSSSAATAGSNMIMSSTHYASSNQQSINENSMILDGSTLNLDDLGNLCSNSSPKDIDNAIKKYSTQLDLFVKQLQLPNSSEKIKIPTLNNINEIIQRAWTVPTFGHKLGYSLCNALRDSGGLDLLMKNCVEGDHDVKFSSAKLLEQCLTIENRSHVVDNGLEKVVNVACVCTKNSKTDHSRIGTGILEHLFKHSEGTCSDVIRLGGLDAVLFECRRNDTETLRHCAGALANLSLYGGAENQEAMISKKVPMWLFPLAFHDDDTVKYYACLAIAALVANKEIEAEVLKSGTLDLVEPFVTTHNPSEFAKSNLSYAHGQSKHWLQRLVPVLNSNREEARNLAAFHFCMEAGIKKEQGCTEIFNEIGAIEPLKTVASCPNAIASKFAAQALRLIGEQVPHKLSQQVPLWSVEDVQEWVKQIGFEEYARNFYESLVDGDLLLQLNECNLREDIGICNGIKRKRFLRELQNLMKMADYSSKDAAKIHNFLVTIGAEYCTYTYAMLNAGVDRETLKHLTEDQLFAECSITNSIHRLRILNALKSQESNYVNASEDNLEKILDVFVSYRRSNGSQLASLLKVHLQLRGFSVFIDVERLEAGKFDNNLLNSIRQAKHFILVLTPEALERCIEDYECKDWVHREIVAALNSNCNIIPIIDNFQWPEPEQLPEDMRSVCHFNGVRWIHDYQDACVDKLERFMRGELSNRITAATGTTTSGGGGTSNSTTGTTGNNNNNGSNNNSGNNNNNNSGTNNGQYDITTSTTPSTPSSASATRGNHPPNYQRMHSNDSGKLSDKDFNGNN